MHGLTLTASNEQGRALIRASGEIDLLTAPELLDAILAAYSDQSREVTVDLGGVSFMDSEGVASLVMAHRKLFALGGRCRFVNVRPRVARVLEITGLSAHFDPEGTEPT